MEGDPLASLGGGHFSSYFPSSLAAPPNLSPSHPSSSANASPPPNRHRGSFGGGSLHEPCLTLILGDENFTFTPCFLESVHHWPEETLEVASCLPEDKLPDSFRPNYLAIKAQGITVHFGVNPAQLRNHFFNNQYKRIVFALPGLALTGFPSFLDKKNDPLFRLRIHIYMFGFLKSSKNALTQPDALVQFLWPRQPPNSGDLPQWVPWHGVELAKIGPFCEIFRSEADDVRETAHFLTRFSQEVLDFPSFQDWHPLIHNIPTESCPIYLQDSVFYSWRLTPQQNPATPPSTLASILAEDSANPEPSQSATENKPSGGVDDKDGNLLFVPPELWNYSVEIISHVNELFKFEMQTNTDEMLVVSKPTLKFDPRFRSDGAPAKNPFAKRGAASGFRGRHRGGRGGGDPGMRMGGAMPPPPPPPDFPPEAGAAPASMGGAAAMGYRPTAPFDGGAASVAGAGGADNLSYLYQHPEMAIYNDQSAFQQRQMFYNQNPASLMMQDELSLYYGEPSAKRKGPANALEYYTNDVYESSLPFYDQSLYNEQSLLEQPDALLYGEQAMRPPPNLLDSAFAAQQSQGYLAGGDEGYDAIPISGIEEPSQRGAGGPRRSHERPSRCTAPYYDGNSTSVPSQSAERPQAHRAGRQQMPSSSSRHQPRNSSRSNSEEGKRHRDRQQQSSSRKMPQQPRQSSDSRRSRSRERRRR